jgi:hypothetical protein
MVFRGDRLASSECESWEEFHRQEEGWWEWFREGLKAEKVLDEMTLEGMSGRIGTQRGNREVENRHFTRKVAMDSRLYTSSVSMRSKKAV